MKDDDPEAIENLLIYLYTLELPNIKKVKDEGARIKIFYHLILVADKYGADALRKEAEEYVVRQIKKCLPAFRHWKDKRKAAWMDWVRQCFTANDDVKALGRVREAMVKELAAFGECLIQREDGKLLMDTNEDFRHGLIMAMSKRMVKQDSFKPKIYPVEGYNLSGVQ